MEKTEAETLIDEYLIHNYNRYDLVPLVRKNTQEILDELKQTRKLVIDLILQTITNRDVDEEIPLRQPEFTSIRVKIALIGLLSKLGEDAQDVLRMAYDNFDLDDELRTEIVSRLSEAKESQLEFLGSVLLKDKCPEIRIKAAEELGNIGVSALKFLQEALFKDFDGNVRKIIITMLLWKIGNPAIHSIVRALEHSDGKVIETITQVFYNLDVIDPIIATKALITELIVRNPDQSDEFFNSKLVVNIFEGLIKRNPQVRGKIMREMCILAFEDNNGVQNRAIAVARGLGADEFASLVKSKSEENPAKATKIMRMLGGIEATAFFSELQSQALDRFRAPLVELEEISRQRWNELTHQARYSFYISMALSIGVFFIGVILIIWGLVLLTRSTELAQQISGGLLSAIAALATTFSTKFWKDPVEHIQKFSAQQARLQTSFIGYMNHIAQLRLVFENHFAKGELSLEDLEKYQKLISESTKQAAQQLSFRYEENYSTKDKE